MSHAVAETVINGFTVEMIPNDGRPGNNCFITKGRVCSSLAKADDFGAIGEPDEPGGEVPISNATLDAIHAFAEQYDY